MILSVKKKRIFLTGITGFLGKYIALELKNQGYDVIALIRGSHRPLILKDVVIEYCPGDLLDLTSYKEVLKRCDVVIHTAAIASFGLKDFKQYYKVNVEGTRLLCDTAVKCGIRRFIHTSTRGVLSVAKHPEDSNEDVGYKAVEHMDDYVQSKFEGEQEVLKISQQGKMDCLVLSPTALVGNCDDQPTPVGRIILSFLQGKTRVYMKGGVNLIDVEDAAKAFVKAIENGKNGEVYIIGNSNIQLYDMFKHLSQLSKVALPKLKIPFCIAYVAAAFIEKISLLFGKKPFATAKKVLSLNRNHSYCNSQKAVREFGLAQAPIQNALEKSVNWYYGNVIKGHTPVRI